MGSKAQLKEARDLIKSKDFKGAMKTCQEILKADDENYMALVLLGACYQDSDKQEATKYLKRAIRTERADHLLALQGLASCAPVKELPGIFLQLLKLQPEKCQEIHVKLLQACLSLTEITDIVPPLYEETKLNESDDSNKTRIALGWSSLVQILMDHSTMAEEKFLNIFEQALAVTAKNVEIPKHLERCHLLVTLYYNQQKFNELLELIIETNKLYPRDTFLLEWFCKVYTENPDLVESEMTVKEIDLSQYVSELLSINATSAIGLMAQAINFYRKGVIIEARDTALKAYEIEPKWPTCLSLLFDIYVKLGAFAAAEFIFNQNEKIIKKDVRIVKALVQQEDAEKGKQAIGICKELLAGGVSDQIEMLIWLTKALLTCDDIARAEKTIEKLESLQCDSDVTTVMKALKLFKSEKDPKIATASLSSNLNLTEPTLLVDAGLMLLSANNIETAMFYFLRAAKIDNCNSETFYWLGKAYNTANDEERCVKCLEKCIQLNFQHSKAVQLISSIYRKRQNWESNTVLLENAVKFAHGSDGKWAYFQLGLHYLAKRRYDDAVNSFRSALRFKSPDMKLYVGLGDAYFARGSYKSALNVYEKALDLEVEQPAVRSYIRLQIASINRTLQNFEEALSGFKELLRENPSYLSALKGIAEAHYELAIHLKKQQRHARARINLQETLNFLQDLIHLEDDIGCAWRLYASVLHLTSKLSVQNRFLRVPSQLNSKSESFVTIRDDALMELAAKCLSRALSLRQDDPIVWRELSNNYLSRAIMNVDETKLEEKQKLFVYAQQAAKQAIKLQPKSWENWNLLGVISVLQPDKCLALAQHCFIQAVSIEKRSGVAWSNLGLLYLSQDNIKLANRAFSKAQQSNENLINAWLGQALIAEGIGETEEAIDLFRHCTELGFHKQSAFGYANRVCSILDESPRLDNILPKYSYVINSMHAVSLAIDQINWYNGHAEVKTEHELGQRNIDSLCFAAHLCIAEKLYENAIKAYTSALALPNVGQSQRNKIMCDLAYVYLKVGNSQKALDTFKKVTEADLKSTIGLALAHSRADNHEEAYSIYGSALEWIASNNVQKSSILTAMSAILYLFQGESGAKTLLFQSLSEKNLQTLLSACALGLLHNDMQLSELVIKQMKEYEDDLLVGHHVVFLITQYILRTKQMKKAIHYASSMVHRFPERPELRRVLSNVLIHYKKSRYEEAAARLALSTVTLDLSSCRVACDSVAVAKSLTLASKSISRLDSKKAKVYAQRAIHINPGCKEAWTAFVAA